MRHLPSAAEAAILLALMAKRKEDEAGKAFPRLRISEITFRKVTRRKRIDGRFVAELNVALQEFNWILIVTDEALGLMRASSVKGWTRLNSSRIGSELKSVRRGQLDFEIVANELGHTDDEDEPDE